MYFNNLVAVKNIASVPIEKIDVHPAEGGDDDDA